MQWLFWILVSNAGIMWLEYAYRAGKYGNFIQAMPTIIFPILVGQLGLYYGFRYAPSLLFAGAVFTLVNVVLRIINSYRLGESLNSYNWTGVALLCVAVILLKIR